MWVRSQDKKKLLKVQRIEICNDCQIFVMSAGQSYKVAEYSTGEKALKVLDMMQEHIKSMFVDTGMFMGYPFQMPLDKEVRYSGKVLCL